MLVALAQSALGVVEQLSLGPDDGTVLAPPSPRPQPLEPAAHLPCADDDDGGSSCVEGGGCGDGGSAPSSTRSSLAAPVAVAPSHALVSDAITSSAPATVSTWSGGAPAPFVVLDETFARAVTDSAAHDYGTGTAIGRRCVSPTCVRMPPASR